MANSTPSPRSLDADSCTKLHHAKPNWTSIALVKLPSGPVRAVHTLERNCRPSTRYLDSKLHRGHVMHRLKRPYTESMSMCREIVREKHEDQGHDCRRLDFVCVSQVVSGIDRRCSHEQEESSVRAA